MKNTTNFLLCCTAALQILLCTLYCTFVLVFYISDLSSEPDKLPYEAACVFYLYVVLSTLANTILMWCTVTVAAFRLLCILFPYKQHLYSTKRARSGVVLIVVLSCVCTVPAGLAHTIERMSENVYTVSLAGVYKHLTFWVNAVLCKLVPCLLLGMLSVLLVREMRLVDEKRQQMMRKQASAGGPDAEADDRIKRTNRTTTLLATIAILFALVYLPQSALEIVGAFSPLFNCYYQALGDVLDELSLINNGVTFILHCVMSQQFRHTLVLLVLAPLNKFLNPCLTLCRLH